MYLDLIVKEYRLRCIRSYTDFCVCLRTPLSIHVGERILDRRAWIFSSLNNITTSVMATTDGLIAQVALEHYEAFNTASSHNKGKKRTEQGQSCRGKPNPDSEWTVYSALVALRRRCRRLPEGRADPSGADVDRIEEDKIGDEAWVVSCATGTKCTTERRNGWILHDGHGEALVRRGLVRALLDEVVRWRLRQSTEESDAAASTRESSRCLLEPIQHAEGSEAQQSSHCQFRIRSETTLHLYISDSPCGDASIYELESPVQSSAARTSVGAAAEEAKKGDLDASDPTQSARNGIAQFTGSKLVVPSHGELTRCCTADGHDLPDLPDLHVLSRSATGGSLIVREVGSNQLLGRLRSKSSRSNVAGRSHSMSCSDKICRWQVLGWQGCALLPILPDPIRVSSVVVSRDPRSAADPSVAESAPSESTNVHCCDQEAALQRALVDRVDRSLTWLLSVAAGRASSTDAEENWHGVYRQFNVRASVVDAPFANGKSQMLWKQSNELSTTAALDANGPTVHSNDTVTSNRKRKRAERATSLINKISPCGFALNWNVSMGRDVLPEVLVGARGVRQGRVPRSDAEHRALASQLCRASLATMTRRALAASRTANPRTEEKEDNDEASALPKTRYQAFKRALAPPGYARLRNQLFNDGASPLAGWLVDEQEGDFELEPGA